MNKFTRSVVAGCVSLNILLFSTTSVTYGLTDEAAYRYAYNTTMGALEAKTQKSISEARTAIKKLDGTSASWAIGEFSSKIDTVQHPILVNIINSINLAQGTPNQTNINLARNLLDPHLPSEWMSTFSSAIDLVQQQIMNEALSLYQKAQLTKTNTSIQTALAKVLEIKQANDSKVVYWANDLEFKLNKLSKGTTIKVYPDVEPTDQVKVSNQEVLKAKYLYIDYLTKLKKEDNKGYYSAVFKDLDFDGIPELIIGKYDAILAPMKYALTVKNNKVKPLNFVGDPGCRGHQRDFNFVGFNLFLQSTLYKLKSTEKIVYIGRDNLVTADDSVSSNATYELYLNDDVLTTKSIFKYTNDKRNKNAEIVYEYMGKKVSEQEYNDALKNYDNSYIEVNDTQNFSGVNLEDNESISRLLNEGFEGFLYTNQQSGPKKEDIKIYSSDAEIKTKNAFKEYSIGKYGIYDDNISYRSYGFLKPGFRIDGKPSQEYYFIRGTLNGEFIQGSFYVHCSTGKVYVRFGEHEIINIPDGKFVGIY